MHMKSALSSPNIASHMISNLRLGSAWLCHSVGLWAGTIISEEPTASFSRVKKILCWLKLVVKFNKAWGFCGSEYEDYPLITCDTV